MPVVVRQQKPKNNLEFITKSREYFFREKAIPLPYTSLNTGEDRILMMDFDPNGQSTKLIDIPRGLYHPKTIQERLGDEAFTEEYFVKILLHGDSFVKWMHTSAGTCRTTIEQQSARECLVDHISFLDVMRQLTAEKRGSVPGPL